MTWESLDSNVANEVADLHNQGESWLRIKLDPGLQFCLIC